MPYNLRTDIVDGLSSKTGEQSTPPDTNEGVHAKAHNDVNEAVNDLDTVRVAALENDTQLTALRALTTTTFGRSLLELSNAAAGRSALGLGTAATKDVGTGSGKVAAGDDSRLSDTRTPTDGSVSKDKLDATTVADILGVSTTASKRRGKAAIPGADTTTSTTYTTLSTPDQVASLVMPSSGLLWVYFRALYKLVGATNAGAIAIFVDSTQVVASVANTAAASVREAALANASTHLAPVGTGPASAAGLPVSSSAANDSPNLGSSPGFFQGANTSQIQPFAIEVPAGTYTISIRYHVNATLGGTLTVQDRLLYVKTEAF